MALAACALFWPQRTVELLIQLLGAYFLIDGAIALFGAVRSGDKAHSYAPAIISLAGGLVLLFWPAVNAKIFLVIVGIWAALQGVGILYSSWQMDRDDQNRWWVAVVGLIVTVVGVLFIAWPETGVVAISWLIGIGDLVVGGLLVFLAFRLRTFTRRVEQIGGANS